MSLNSRIDQIFEQWNTKNSPGMAIAVTKNGEVVHRNAYGMADLDHGIANTPGTVFQCASLAKQFTAMSIVLLSQRKKKNGRPVLALDDDVHKHIPELSSSIPPVTIRQMLNHTSGIRDMLIQLTLDGWRWGDDVMTRDDVLRLVSRMKTLNSAPGSEFAYSNTNYFLAGEVVKNASGQSLAEFAQENIFGPLFMRSTRFVDTYCETVKNRAYGYKSSKRVSGALFEKRVPNYDLTGPTNLYTTVDDLMLWDAIFDPRPGNDKAAKVGGPSTVAELQQPTTTSDGYGLGLYVLRDGKDKPLRIHHNGRGIGYRAHLVHDYRDGISVALLCNVEFTKFEATDKLTSAVADVVNGEPPSTPIVEDPVVQDPPATRSKAVLDQFCGTYYSSELDTEYEVKEKKPSRAGEKPSLVIKRPKYLDCPLADHPDRSHDTFEARNFTAVLRHVKFTFVRNRGRIKELQLDWLGGMPRLTNFRFVRR